MKINLRLSFLLMIVVLSSPLVNADDFRVHEELGKALTCDGNPVATVDGLLQQGVRNYQSGYAAASFGEGASYRGIIILQNPLALAGAHSSTIIREVEQSHFDFDAVIYGRFKGDYRKVIGLLKLSPASKTIDTAPFQRRLSTNIDGRSDEICPKTIKLKPLENGEFLLGCGWCNG